MQIKIDTTLSVYVGVFEFNKQTFVFQNEYISPIYQHSLRLIMAIYIFLPSIKIKRKEMCCMEKKISRNY